MRKLLWNAFWLLVSLSPLYGAVGTIADLNADWSDSFNAPNGWSYKAGTTPLGSHISDWTPIRQPAWAPGNTSTNFIPGWFKATAGYQGSGIDLNQGDVGVYSWDSVNGANNGIANVTWTSTINATVTISGSIWNADLANARDNTYVLKLNGASLTNGVVSQGIDNRSKPVNFSFIRSISVGDVIELDIVKPASQGNGTWAGINLTISLVSQTKILPQLAFGGGWYSALYFTNLGVDPVSVPVSFIGDDGNPLSVPSVGGASKTVVIAPRGTAVIEALDSGPLVQGYVSVSLPAGVAGYGVFRQRVAGRPDQEAVVPLFGASSTMNTLIWDEMNLTTTVAIVNPSLVSTTVTITARNDTGATFGTAQVVLGPRTKKALVLRDLQGLTAIMGSRGSADFSVLSGNVAVLGLRFGPSAFTSIPTTEK